VKDHWKEVDKMNETMGQPYKNYKYSSQKWYYGPTTDIYPRHQPDEYSKDAPKCFRFGNFVNYRPGTEVDDFEMNPY